MVTFVSLIFSFSLHFQRWQFKTSKSFLQKLEITNAASKSIIVTLFIVIRIPNNCQQMNTKSSSIDNKQ